MWPFNFSNPSYLSLNTSTKFEKWYHVLVFVNGVNLKFFEKPAVIFGYFDRKLVPIFIEPRKTKRYSISKFRITRPYFPDLNQKTHHRLIAHQ